MLQRFKRFISENDLLNTSDRVILGVSGGIDSVVMTDLFSKVKLEFVIAHCNFGLRGKESDEDEVFVKKLAKTYDVPFYAETFKTKEYANQHKCSIQMAARDLRMNWLHDLLTQYSLDYVATAHHLDDQIETFFINILRGTGLSGLHGILPKQNRLIHPLIFAYRNEIVEYAKNNKLDYQVDSTNLESNYTRNKIRNKVIPIFKSINENCDKVLSGNIERFRKIEHVYKQQINEVAKKVVIQSEGNVRILLMELEKFFPMDTYLFEFLSPYNYTYANAKDIINSMGSISGKVFYSKTHKAVIDRDTLIIEAIDPNRSAVQEVYEITTVGQSLSYPITLEFNTSDKFMPDSNPNIECFDLDFIKFPLILRRWKNGDYFVPIGMKNKKLLSDFFIDNKMSLFQKEKIWLLCSGDDIVWIIGYRMDNRFKVISKTKKILSIKYIP